MLARYRFAIHYKCAVLAHHTHQCAVLAHNIYKCAVLAHQPVSVLFIY